MKFYKHNNAMLELIKGESLLPEIVSRGVDASKEKHVPQIFINGNEVKIKVGEVTHPMTEEHYIEFIEIETKKGSQRKFLNPGDNPEATFLLIDDELVSAYAYCNLHGMWDNQVK